MNGAAATRTDKRTHIEAFARSFLECLTSSLYDTCDNGSARVCENLRAIHQSTGVDGGLSPAEAILRARREVGRSNDAYLQCGLSVLWSGDDTDNDTKHVMYPASSTAGCGDRASHFGIAEERVLEQLYEQANAQLRGVRALANDIAPRRLAYLLTVPEIGRWVYDHLVSVDPPSEARAKAKSLLGITMNGSTVLSSAEEVFGRVTDSPTEQRARRQLLAKRIRELSVVGAVGGRRPVDELLDAFAALCDTGARAFVEDSMRDPTDNSRWTRMIKDAEPLRLALLDHANKVGALPPRAMNAGVDRMLLARDEPDGDEGPLLPRGLVALGDVRPLGDPRDLPERPYAGLADPSATALFVPDGFGGTGEQASAVFATARSRRAVRSLVINLYRGGVCELPPHVLTVTKNQEPHLAKPRRPYALPYWSFDPTDGEGVGEPLRGDHVTTIVPSEVARLVWEWHGSAPFRYPNGLGTSVPNKGPRKVDGALQRALWAPTTRGGAGATLEIPRFGNVSLRASATHTSYATLVAATIETIETIDGADEVSSITKTWAIAVLKLDMLPSLRYLYGRVAMGLDIQTDMSGEQMNRVTTAGLIRKETDILGGDELVYHPSSGSHLGPAVCGLASRRTFDSISIAAGEDDSVSAGIEGGLGNTFELPKRDEATGRVGVAAFDEKLFVPLSASHFDEAPGRPAVSLVPAFASPIGLSGIVSRIRGARRELERLESTQRAYAEAIEQVREGRVDGTVVGGGLGSGTGSGSAGLPDAESRCRRVAIWDDALRELAIGGDRLFTFLKVMAGVLSEEVTQIIKLEDRSMEQHHKLYREQRREALRDISKFSQRVIDTILGSVFQNSKLRVDLDQTSAQIGASEAANSLVVVSEEGIERINELASGTSGLGFLETNAQLSNYLNTKRGTPVQLKQLVVDLRDILDSHRNFVLHSLQAGQEQGARSSMEYLAEPKNSLVVRLRNETFAAIRVAYDQLSTELRARGWRDTDIPLAYVCVEGHDSALCNQFAQLTAYQLQHGRTFSSSSAAFVGITPARVNLAMINISLNKMVNRVSEHRVQVQRGVYPE